MEFFVNVEVCIEIKFALSICTVRKTKVSNCEVLPKFKVRRQLLPLLVVPVKKDAHLYKNSNFDYHMMFGVL
jgi:hypothetical protein